jgi:trans-aconitate 2-methyltransferase
MVSPAQTWNSQLYQDKHAFVWQLGSDLVDWLNPLPGERILDLGCGTGQLTQAIAARGAVVQGIDPDAAMVTQAQHNAPEIPFSIADARSFEIEYPVDAVFSNAVLHWIAASDQPAVAQRIWLALKPGGRWVTEFGGQGNMAQVLTALAAARQALAYGPSPAAPWYFPSIGTYGAVLEAQGFEIQGATLRDRPTPLVGEEGLVNWLRMFAGRFFDDLSPDQQQRLFQRIQDHLRPHLYRQGQWIADYRRLRVCAIKPAAAP